MKILVVEDDRTSRVLLERTLRRWGHEVIVAEDGLVGWELYQQEPVGVVITDWMMPRLGGLELCQRIRGCKTLPYTMVILLTVREERSDLLEAFEAGVDDFLTKPFDPDELKARIKVGERVVALERELKRRIEQLDRANHKMRQDLMTAARLQEALLPTVPEQTPGVHFAWHFQPCEELAGDILNVFPLGPTQYGMYLLDVSGHGVASALMSVALSRLLSPAPGESLLVRYQDGIPVATRPSVVLEELNRRFPIEKNPGAQYFTIIYAVLDMAARRITYAVAGHPPPLWQETGHPEGARVLEGGGLPIGFVGRPGYEDVEVDVSRGGRMLFYSDGLTEATHTERGLFGEERLCHILDAGQDRPVEAVLEQLGRSAVRWGPGAAAEDDISMLCAEIAPSA